MLALLSFTLRRHPSALGSAVVLAAATPPFLAGRLSRESLKGLALGLLRHVPAGRLETFLGGFHRR